MLKDDHDSEAMSELKDALKGVPDSTTACPFCGDKMTRGNIWVSGGSLCWQKGRVLKRGILGKTPDEILLDEGTLISPAKRAFFCYSCEAMLTDFENSSLAEL